MMILRGCFHLRAHAHGLPSLGRRNKPPSERQTNQASQPAQYAVYEVCVIVVRSSKLESLVAAVWVVKHTDLSHLFMCVCVPPFFQSRTDLHEHFIYSSCSRSISEIISRK